MDTAIKNLENQRQLKLKQLIQVSENYQDLKKFEVQAPQLLLSIRELILKIIIGIKKIQKLKDPLYIEQVKVQNKAPAAEYFFEMECGQGNILDLIRDCRVLTMSNQLTGTKRLLKTKIQTFLIQKLSVFLEDATIFFIPKSSQAIMETLR
jgi:hypothetical protein